MKKRQRRIRADIKDSDDEGNEESAEEKDTEHDLDLEDGENAGDDMGRQAKVTSNKDLKDKKL